MREDEGTFQGVGGVQLYYRSWHPQVPPRAIAVIVHGLGSHIGLFGNIVESLVPRNYGVYGFDLRGHGHSSGGRGYINRWAEFQGDLATFLQLIRDREGGCPCFLIGHSLGATIVLDYTLRFPEGVEGAIAMAPAIGQIGISPFKLALGQLLSWIYPQFALSTGIDLTVSSRDPQVLAAYAQDPWRHDRGTARLVTEFLATVDWIWSRVGELSVPLLILHGGADRVTLPSGSRKFFEHITFPDTEFKEYPEAYHELHNDLNYLEVLADIADWMEKRL